jgi:SAM-dependent methyltransferase
MRDPHIALKDQVSGNIAIWILETGTLSEALPAATVYATEYLGDEHFSGKMVSGIRHEDAMNPSFSDNTLDVILSSDVFEHIPDPYMAHEALFRRLKPGGSHIFTVPFVDDWKADQVRARIIKGQLVHYHEKVFHGDPLRSEGALVFTIFGREMISRLERIGYNVTVNRVHCTSFGILGGGNLVFTATKPAQY